LILFPEQESLLFFTFLYNSAISFDGFIISLNYLFYVIPAKAGHLVKRERYPVFSAISGLPFSRE